MDLEKELIKIIEKKRKITFNELINHFSNKDQNEIIKALDKLEDEEKIVIEPYLPKDFNFIKYLKDLSYNLWFYLVILVVVVVNLFVFIIPNVYPYNIFRWIFSAIFIVYLPGFTLIETLFPSRSELESLERFGLHIATSIGVVPLLGLLLNYSPWKLKLEPIMFTLTVFILTLAITALIVKYKVYKNAYKNKVLVIIFLSIIFLSFYINQINGIELDENYYYAKIENVIKKINEIYYKGIKDDRLNIITNIINEAILNIEKGKMVKEKGNLEEAQKYFEKADNLINEAENEADKLLEEARIKDQNLKLTAYSTAVVAAIITYFSSILLFRFHNYWKRRKLENCIVIKK